MNGIDTITERQREIVMKPDLVILLIISLWSTGYSQANRSTMCPGGCFIFPRNRKPGITPRIMGGFEVQPPHSFPYQVALYISNIAFCGGTLIARDWVLTAAHCLEGNPRARDITASLGRHNLHNSEFQTRQIITVSNYFIHPRWDDMHYVNDLALLKLSRNATLNQYVSTVALCTERNSYAGVLGATLGWGITETNFMSSVLRIFYNPVLSNEECRSVWPFNEVITRYHVCVSGRNNMGSCNGDSGGPLIVNNMQLGIVSFGYILCNESKPSVYTRLTEYNNWITHTMENSARSREVCGFVLLFLMCVCIFRIIFFI